MADSWDEEELLAALRQAFDPQPEPPPESQPEPPPESQPEPPPESQREPPPEIVEAGKRMFAWHAIGKELAQLTYDSAREPDRALAVRTETADIRGLTFSSARLTIELEFTAEAVLGQVIPPQVTQIMVQFSNGRETDLAADGTGCFSIRPAPPAAFRLRCQTGAGPDVLTGWITP